MFMGSFGCLQKKFMPFLHKDVDVSCLKNLLLKILLYCCCVFVLGPLFSFVDTPAAEFARLAGRFALLLLWWAPLLV